MTLAEVINGANEYLGEAATALGMQYDPNPMNSPYVQSLTQSSTVPPTQDNTGSNGTVYVYNPTGGGSNGLLVVGVLAGLALLLSSK